VQVSLSVDDHGVNRPRRDGSLGTTAYPSSPRLQNRRGVGAYVADIGIEKVIWYVGIPSNVDP
jgi:hypothetical protein